MQDLMRDLGVRPSLLLAGFAGGMLSIFVKRPGGFWEAFGAVLAGMVTANYLGESTEPLLHFIGFDDNPGAGGFVTGLAAMSICQGIFEAVRGYFDRPRRNPDDWPPIGDHEPPTGRGS
jgi:hypothetical protein